LLLFKFKNHFGIFISSLLIIGCTSHFNSDNLAIKSNLHTNCNALQPETDDDLRVFWGPEDITIHQSPDSVNIENKIAFISVSKRKPKPAIDSIPGAIFSLRLNGDFQPAKMKIKPSNDIKYPSENYFEKNFFPHGISIYGDRLFVINHRLSTNGSNSIESLVEIFDIDFAKNTLNHIRRIPGKIGSTNLGLNDLVATGPMSFYATDNGVGIISELKGLFAALSGTLGQGRVVFFSDNNYQKTRIQSLNFANGITVSDLNPKGEKYLYVSSSADGILWEYKFPKGKTNSPDSLQFIQKTGFDSGLDNIELEDNRKKILLIGSHASITTFTLHSLFGKLFDISPSEAFRIPIDNKTGIIDRNKIEKIFYDNGKKFSGSSVAVMNPPYLLLGAVYENKIYSCIK